MNFFIGGERLTEQEAKELLGAKIVRSIVRQANKLFRQHPTALKYDDERTGLTVVQKEQTTRDIFGYYAKVN